MKYIQFTIIVAVVVWTNLADGKTIRTNQALKKAAAALKPTKSPKNVLEVFKNLPADDFEFIKQLDKQYSKFGNNVRIKVQNVNRTTSKNQKRTIDGSLGYGYQHQNLHDQHSMYSFSKPKYEYYPYSQHDIPPSHDYQEQQNQLNYLRHYPQAVTTPDYYHKPAEHTHTRTSVEIQPSHSYEIKQTEHGYKTIYHGHDDGSSSAAAAAASVGRDYGHSEVETPSHESVPVIVLRVPGPAKYAAHLQALLQQYLETRAAQYIQSLQEQEARSLQTSQQIDDHSHEHNLHSYGALPSQLPVLPYAQHQAYLPAQMFIQPLQQIQPYYAQVQNPYANAHIAQSIEVADDEHVVATPAPAAYYSHQTLGGTDHHSGVVHPTSYEYHNIHDEPQPQHHDAHSNEQVIYGQPHHETVSQHNELLTTENFPSDKHTQVFFKSSTEPSYQSDEQHYAPEEHHHHHQQQQYLAPAQVNTYRAPLVYHKYEEQYYNQHGDDQGDGAQYADSAGYDDNAQSLVSSTPYASTIAITQRPAVLPHNYHAELAASGNYGDDQSYDYSTEASDDHLYRRNANKKRQSIQNRDEVVKRFANVASRMKKRSRSPKSSSTTPQSVQE